MKYILALLVLVIICIMVYEIARFLTLKNEGERLAKRTEPFSVHPANPTKRILVLGDSLAVGVGASTPEHSIAGLISGDYPSADITNIAVSGSVIKDALRMVEGVGDKHFDIIIIQIGGNDVVHFSAVKDACSDLADLLTQAKTKADKVIFFSSGSVGFAPIFPEPLDWIFTARTKKLYTALKEVAVKQSVVYIDLYYSRKEDPFQRDTDKYYADDYFHVGDAGYALWYAKIKPSLE